MPRDRRGLDSGRNSSTIRKAARERVRFRAPILERLEGRLVLSLAPTALTVATVSGIYGGTATMAATLTSGGTDVAGETVDFHIGAVDLGPAVTDVNGLATINGASLGFIDVGTYIGDVTASFAGDASFNPSNGSSDLTITPAPLTVAANDQAKVYGQINPTLTGIVAGILNGDDVTANFATTASQFSDVQAGGYPINFTGLTGAKALDYSTTVVGGSSTGGTLTATPAPLAVVVNNQAKVYGQANPSLTGTVAGILNGDDVTANFATTASNSSGVQAGGYPITVASLSGTKAIDYSTTVVGGSVTLGSLTVTPAPLTITANNQAKVYGAASPTLTASYTGFVNGDTSASLIAPPTLSTTATAASHVSGNPYAITASGAVDPDYSISYVAGSLTVTPAPLTIVANDQSKIYGAASPTLTASYTGFVNGDTSASLTAPPTLSTTATAASHVSGGPYAIAASGAVDPDYSISYVAGSLGVTPAPLTIVIGNSTRVYGQANPTLTGTVTGILNGDDVAASYATTASQYSDVQAGGFPITLSDLTGTMAGDYSTTVAGGSVTPGTLTVTPAPLTIVAHDQSKVYGQSNPSFDGQVTGVLNGDDVTANLTTAASQYSDVVDGGYPITFSGLTGAKAADYSTTVTGSSVSDGVLTVTPAPLTITLDSQSRLYGQANPTLTGTVAGVLNGDDVTVVYDTSATQYSDVQAGGYAITATHSIGAKAEDYSPLVPGGSLTDGTLTVVPAPLAVVVNNKTKVYGQASPTLTGTVTGILNGDNVTAQYATPATTSSHVVNGGFPITVSGLSGSKAGDYAVMNPTAGVLTVTPAPLTVAASSGSKVYGQSTPAFHASFGGFTLGQGPGSLSGVLGFSTPATAASHVGVYPIIPSGLTSSDYAIRFINGNLGVTPASLVVTAPNVVKAYGQAIPTLTASYSGFVNGDSAAGLTTQATLSTTATAASAPGLYPILPGGGSSADYTIVNVPGTLNIRPSPLPSYNPAQVAFVSSLYRDILGRAPEPFGLSVWIAELNQGATRAAVAQRIYHSSEAVTYRSHHRGHTITEAKALAHALQAQKKAGHG